MPVLQELDPDLWIAEQPLRVVGVELGARMAIVRGAGSRLLLYSPIAYTAEMSLAIDELGSPTHVVAPNRFHHLFAGDWKAAYPDSQLVIAPGLQKKRPDLPVDAVLDDNPLPGWSDVLDHVLMEGFPLNNEAVFFHRPSATLISSDLLFNMDSSSPWLTRLAFRFSGGYGKPGATLLERLFVRDRTAFRRSLERILAWPIERIVLAHGKVVESGGRAALESAYSWILRDGASR